MSDKKELITRGVLRLVWAFPLMFIGPGLIYNAFMNKHTAWHYLVLGIGIIICITSVYFAFKGIKMITDAFFDEN
ncbi:MAG: DUF6095 family protein [Flavobacterium sp.]